MLAIAVLPASLPLTFGHMVGRPRAGWLLLFVMFVVFLAGLVVCDAAESRTPVQYGGLNVEGGNMEGKEMRLGVGASVLTAVTTSNGATGSYNSMHGTHRGEFMGIPPTGRTFTVNATDICRFTDDGLISEHWGVFDMGSMLQQLGVGAPTG